MRAEFHATGSRPWLAEGQESAAQREARLRSLVESDADDSNWSGGTANAAAAVACAASSRPLALSQVEVSDLDKGYGLWCKMHHWRIASWAATCVLHFPILQLLGSPSKLPTCPP